MMMTISCDDSSTAEQPLFQVADSGSTPRSPLQLEIKRCSVDYAIKLNADWHSRVPIIEKSNILRNRFYCCFVAEFEDRPYAVAIWSSPIAANRMKNGQRILELRRMAISDEAPKNTASRMISVMVKMIRKQFPDVVRLISYQDTGSHLGTIYKASNWVQTTHSTLNEWRNRENRNAPQAPTPKIKWEYELQSVTEDDIQVAKPKQSSFDDLFQIGQQ